MYNNAVTIFNKSGNEKTGFVWYPTVIMGVDLLIDKSVGMAKTGLSDANKANLHIRYCNVDGRVIIDGKPYILPKAWGSQGDELKTATITFNEGEDFFIEGEYSPDVVRDDDIMYTNGFFAYMKAKYDNVFKINTVGKYSLIPHFEIGGE